ncbi:MAG: glycosyl hydrolase family 39 [Bryobacteraceae bacterium]
MRRSGNSCVGLWLALWALPMALPAQEKPQLQVNWDKEQLVLKTSATLQVVVNPLLRRGSRIHDQAFAALRQLSADYVRYVPWLPYPRLAVAELEPPTSERTSWDFSLIDPMTLDFLEATAGHPVILNFSTIPAWLFQTEAPVTWPKDPDQVFWSYTKGAELREGGLEELGQYYARLVSWYTQGGFTDELGQRHTSNHRFKIPYWEVFNEPDIEHQTTAEQYTARYDAVVSAIRAVEPEMKFVGLSLAYPSTHPEMFEYFLNPKNHQPGIPLDLISYHFYAVPTKTQTVDHWQYTLFDQADRFLATVRYVEAIRKRLSPQTKTTLNELGTILPTDWHPDTPYAPDPPIPKAYWNLSGALYAYLYLEVAKLGIDIAGESQLVGYPSQFPSVTMIDWTTGEPNARYRVLKLIHDHLAPGDLLARTRLVDQDIAAQGFRTARGNKLLLINKRNRDATVNLAQEIREGTLEAVDVMSGSTAPSPMGLSGKSVTLRPFSVAIVTLGR